MVVAAEAAVVVVAVADEAAHPNSPLPRLARLKIACRLLAVVAVVVVAAAVVAAAASATADRAA